MEQFFDLLNQLTVALSPLLDWIAGLDLEWQVFGGCIVALLLWMMLRERDPAGKKARSTTKDLRKQYKRLGKKGVPDWQRPFALFATRSGWQHLPKPFLLELASRLMDQDKVVEFILFAEKHGLESTQLSDIAKGDVVEAAMRNLAAFLIDFSEELSPDEVKDALSLAVMVDPENPMAIYDLAIEHYVAERFGAAVTLLEQVMQLCDQLDTGVSMGGGQPNTREMFLRARGMYDDCMDRLGHQPA